MNTELRAYHGDPKLKRAMLREVRKHEKADQIVSGTYGKENGKWSAESAAYSTMADQLILLLMAAKPAEVAA